MSWLSQFRSATPTEGCEELCTVLLPDSTAKWAALLSEVPPSLRTELREHSFQREHLDVRFAEGTSLGGAHVRVALAPSQSTISERISAIRHATQLACAFVDAGALGVVIHPAGDVVYSPRRWSHRTSGRSRPQWAPSLAWTDWGHQDGVASSSGLGAFGLPEVVVDLQQLGTLSGDEVWHRAQEAMLAAITTMVARGTPLEENELLKVIAGTEFSGAPLQFDNLGLDEPAAETDTFAFWGCQPVGRFIRLVPPPMLSLSSRFKVLQDVGLMPHPAYRWLFLERLKAQGYIKVAAVRPHQPPDSPAFEVLVLQHEEGERFLTITCGLGRVAQPNGTEEGENQYIEFAVEFSTHNPPLAHALGTLALLLHCRSPDAAPIGRGHRVQTPPDEFRYEWAVYDSLPDLDLGGSSPIRLYQPLFMSEHERSEVPLGQIADWIEANRGQVLSRWLTPWEDR